MTNATGLMTVKVLHPCGVALETSAERVGLEAADGAVTLLPRHVDFATVLVPGIVTVVHDDGRETFVAVDEGIAVKAGPSVMISTRSAVVGDDLEGLRDRVDAVFRALDDEERVARTSTARLEADLVRRFMELSGHGR